MTRKPLPKAIVRPLDSLRVARGAALDAPLPAPQPALPHDAVEPEPALRVSSAPIANDATPDVSPAAQQFAAKRHALARKIVERHRTFAAVGGLLPLPIITVAGITAINLRMVKQLSDLYGVPFQRDRTRAIIVGLIGGAVPTGLGVTTASTLAFAMPGPALVGLAVSAIAAGAMTRGIGRVFVEHFEAGALPPTTAQT
ncbi:MAG TPA: YcjF family protein [Xanthobacteraceae bacterium]|jgi:uncharacterized protein (DUF697 family)|nr:YcjF family protein [Xanthobacteraceae bacterium]